MELITQAAMAVLIDRLGSSVVVSQADRDAVATRYGGAVGIHIEEMEAGRTYRFTLVAASGSPPSAKPVS